MNQPVLFGLAMGVFSSVQEFELSWCPETVKGILASVANPSAVRM